MRRVKTLILLGVILVFLMGTTSMSYANSYEFHGHCSYNGKKITSDFSSKDFAAAQKNLQPGDSLRYVVTYKNNSDETVDFYMRNKVLETLEEKKDAAENGGYTYVLKNSGPGGDKVLFSNDEVGGDYTPTKALEGLLQATNATGKFFFIQELKPGQSAKTILKVGFDGETEVNDYMNTEGSLLVQYAVEKKHNKKKVKTIVSKTRTGDTAQILLFACLMAAAVIVGVIALIMWRRDRRREEKGGETA